jgi:2,5-furandicarboxylate decarboxylase 1
VGGSMGRLALALGCSLREVSARFQAATTAPIPPELTRDAPVQSVVHRGDAIDLGMLPRLRYHADDAEQPYITAALVVARDPETGVANLSYHRMMIVDAQRTTIYMEPGRHLHAIHGKWSARGEPMPIAVAIGVHPAWSLGALYAGPASVDEYDVIGGLLGAPLPVAETVTGTGLKVPARAEIVLEGEVAVAGTLPEGPFGEFTGYGTGMTQSPVFHCRAITHREDPMMQDIVSGGLEHLLLSVPALEHRTRRDATAACPGVTAVALPAPLTAVVAIDKQSDEEPRRVIEALLEGDIYAKHVIVVDADVDPGDFAQVLGAMALHTQADTGVLVLTDRRGTPLDPSCRSDDGRTAKMGIDATRPLRAARHVTKNRIPQHVLDAVDLDLLLGRR